MKPFLMLLLSPFIFSSCLVVKIYESPKEIAQEPVAPKEVHHKMIGSGKVIDLGENGSHEIMFFGKDESPKGFLFKKAPSDSSAVWIEKGSQKNIKLVTDSEKKPLIVLDGKILEHPISLSEIDSDSIESINVFKGDAALKKYGEKGVNGVIEITSKGD